MKIITKTKYILFSVTAALGLMTVFALPAQAVPVEATFEGEVTYADSNNPLGVTQGDSVWVTAEWEEDDVYGSGSYEELYDWISLMITIGNAVFYGDTLYDALVFDYGTLVGFYLDGIPSDDYDELYADGGPFFTVYSWNDTMVEGEFNMSTPACKYDCGGGDDKPTSVPEPGTLGLLGIGLLSIAVRRRRQTLAS